MGCFTFFESKILIFMQNMQKNFREIDLFDFVTFLEFSGSPSLCGDTSKKNSKGL